jgi:hypothetical protein
MLGRSGLDINDPDEKYSLKSLPGKFSGLHLLAIMYTAFRQIDPTMDTGADFARRVQGGDRGGRRQDQGRDRALRPDGRRPWSRNGCPQESEVARSGRRQAGQQTAQEGRIQAIGEDGEVQGRQRQHLGWHGQAAGMVQGCFGFRQDTRGTAGKELSQAQRQRMPLFGGVPLTRSCGGPYRVMACEQDIADHSCSQQRTVKASP